MRNNSQGAQRVDIPDTKISSTTSKMFSSCNDPELPAILDSAKANSRRAYLYRWRAADQTYVGDTGNEYIAGVLSDISKSSLKNPQHPKATQYRCFIALFLVLLLLLLILGLGSSATDSQQSVFMIIWLLSTGVFLYCGVFRIRHTLAVYHYRRQASMTDAFRKRQASAPHVYFSLAHRGWTLVAEVQEHVPHLLAEDVSIKQPLGAPRYSLKEHGAKKTKEGKHLDNTDDENDNKYGEFDQE